MPVNDPITSKTEVSVLNLDNNNIYIKDTTARNNINAILTVIEQNNASISEHINNLDERLEDIENDTTQVDWNQTTTTAKDYIKNKPSITTSPSNDSAALITSGGVYTALSGKQDTIDSSHKLSADLVEDGTTNKVYTATEKTKLSGIAAGAEVNVQADWNQTTTTADDYIKNKPDIDDITGMGIRIGRNSSQSQVVANGYVYISDGRNSISLDTSNDSGISIIANDGSDGTITLTASSNIWINPASGSKAYYNNKEIATKNDIPTIPTNVSAFNNDAGYLTSFTETDPIFLASAAYAITSTDISNWNAKVSNVQADWNATSGLSQILNKPTLATVATSGSYNDLSNKPTIPNAQIQSDWNQTTATAKDYIKNKPTALTNSEIDTIWNTVMNS